MVILSYANRDTRNSFERQLITWLFEPNSNCTAVGESSNIISYAITEAAKAVLTLHLQRLGQQKRYLMYAFVKANGGKLQWRSTRLRIFPSI